MDILKAAIAEKKQIIFAVTEPRKSFAGYTVYRLQLKTYINEDETQTKAEFLGWKRFNDFKKLHKSLKSSFPGDFRSGYNDFIKGNFFGRFDESVIEERRQAALRLLSFIALYPEMLTHPSFEAFMDSDVKNVEDSQRQTSVSSSEDFERSSPVDCGNEENEEDSFGSINNNDEIDGLMSLQQMTVVEDAEEPEVPEDEVFISVENGSSDDGRQSWLREARSLCGDDLESLASEAADDFPITPRASLIDEDSVLFGDPLDEDILCDPPSISAGQDEVKEEAKPATAEVINESINKLTAKEVSKENICEFQHKLQVDEKMSAIISKTVQEDDYIFQASVAMSNAIEQEELGNVEAAFDMYKFGIGLLLCGVQSDTNVDRREAVRRKTAQYLLRAETLYNSNIAPVNKKITEKTEVNRTTISLDNKWRFRLSDVKVIGVIDKVMLVQKIFSQSDDAYIMKVLHKQGAEYKRTIPSKKGSKTQRNLYNCRFMAYLTNCVETKTGIYLLLEYVAGGRLWDYLGMPMFMNRRRSFYNSSSEVSHHSWNPSDHNTSVNHEQDNIDIVDIPSTNYVRQGSHALSSHPRGTSISCKIKRSPCSSSQLDEGCVKLWAAQIAMALIDLHTKGVLCRDLNPRNILLDSQGNVKLTYFSNVDGTDDTLDENAVNFLYTSPEADGIFEPSTSTDWWSFGTLLFELLTGDALHTCHPNGINERSIITLPRRVSNEACSLLAGLLKYHPKERLGSGPTGNEEIKAHPFFLGIDWDTLKQAGQLVSR